MSEAASDNPGTGKATEPVVSVRGLCISVPEGSAASPRRRIVTDLTFDLVPGRVLALVGESGSGKSMTALSLPGLLPPTARVDAGEVWLRTAAGAHVNLLHLKAPELRRVRGRDIAMIFQEPLTSLNPVMTIGEQLVEAVQLHTRVSAREARDRSAAALGEVGVREPRARLTDYPHQFSGGLRQRAMIAMALVCNPRVLIADEPTTALDVTVQAQVLDLLCRLRDDRGLAILLITHDLRLVANRADGVCVMRSGSIVEYGSRDEVLASPRHAYTRALIACVPQVGVRRERLVTVEDS